MKCVKYIKICFRMKEILHLTVPWNFQPNPRLDFSCLFSRTCFCCHIESLKAAIFYRNTKVFLQSPTEISLICILKISLFLFVFLRLKKDGKLTLISLSKHKPCQGAIHSRSSILSQSQKITFDFTELVKNYGLKQGVVYFKLWVLLPTHLWNYT